MEVDIVYEENILSKIGKEKPKQVLTDSKPVIKTVVKTVAKPVETGLEEKLQSIPENEELPSIRLNQSSEKNLFLNKKSIENLKRKLI